MSDDEDDDDRKPAEDTHSPTSCKTNHQAPGAWTLQTHKPGWKNLSSEHVLAALLPNQGYLCIQKTTINLTNLSINCHQIKPSNFN